MADFSHIEAIGMHLQIERVCSGERLGDHELLEIVQYIDPPLLSPEHMDTVVNELDESHPRKRGRPAGMIAPRKLMADHIESISRPDIPDKFLEALAERLRSGRRFPYSARARKAYRENRASKMHLFISALYADAKEAMAVGKTQIQYPEMEPFKFPEESENFSLHERALRAVNHIMRTYLNVDPPSERRMLNIISGQR